MTDVDADITRYFVRIRGRVSGPYDLSQLRMLVQRGQVGRMHEVSTDGRAWTRASTASELFPPPAPPPAGASQPASVAAANCDYPLGAAPPAASATQPPGVGLAVGPGPAAWYYTYEGQRQGPLAWAQLRELFHSGRLDSSEQVWGEGYPDWQTASAVPGLTPAASPPLAAAEEHGELPEAICTAAGGSRGWCIFLAVLLFVWAALLLFFGVHLMILGARANDVELTVPGLFGCGQGVLLIVGGAMLLDYVRWLGALRYERNMVALRKALVALGRFWTYVSIVAIVGLTMLAIVWFSALATS